MTRKKFTVLLLLPLLLVFPLLLVDMPVEAQIAVFVLVCLYTWMLHFIRLRFLGFTWKQCLIGFFTGALGKTWWKVWEKDSVKRTGTTSSLPSF